MHLDLPFLYQRIVVILLAFFLSVFFIRHAIQSWVSELYAQEAPQPQGLRKALSFDPENPQYYFSLGTYLHIFDYTAYTEEVFSFYKRALELSPFNHGYWISLAEFLAEEGKNEKAMYALWHATDMAPAFVPLRWRAGMLAIKLGNKEAVLENLSVVIASDPKKRTGAYAALWQMIEQGEEILDKVSEDALPSYLGFLMDTGRAAEARLAWKRLRESGNTSRELLLKYVDFLLREGYLTSATLREDYISSAKGVWKEAFGDWGGVWNGDFEEEPMKGGFDWGLDEVEGAEIERDKDKWEGNYSIKVAFDGEHNVDFHHLWQIVPVDKDSDYILSSYMKSDGITTRNGIQWEIYCYDSEGLYSVTEPLVGTHNWHLVKLSFRTPVGCRAVVVRLRRFESDRLDRLISGRIWVDKVELNKSNMK